MAACNVIYSSRHSRSHSGAVDFSFKGQNGIDFLKKLIFEFNSTFETEIPVNLQFERNENFDLLNFLNNSKIPFLLGVDNSFPDLVGLSSISENFYVAPYYRSPNSDQIDGKFEFSYNDVCYEVICECKNKGNTVSSKTLHEILEKASEHIKSKISLIICTDAVRKPSKWSKFSWICSKNNINVYRLDYQAKRSFNVIKFVPNFKIHKNPSHVSFVLEINEMNKRVE